MSDFKAIKCTKFDFRWGSIPDPAARAYFNVPTGKDVLGDLKSVLECLVTRA